MKRIKYFKTQEDFIAKKPTLPYPCVSYVKGAKKIEYQKESDIQPSSITAKYIITQDVIDEYSSSELFLYRNTIGSLKSYTLNGETYNFEEPIYENTTKIVSFEEYETFYDLPQYYFLNLSELNSSVIWSTDADVNNGDYYVHFEIKYSGDSSSTTIWLNKNNFVINFLGTIIEFVFNETKTSFYLTQESCDNLRQVWGKNCKMIAYFGENNYWVERTKNFIEINGVSKELVLEEFISYAQSNDTILDFYTTEDKFIANRQLDLQNDGIVLTYACENEKYYDGCEFYTLEEAIDEGMINVYDNYITLTNDFCQSINGDAVYNFYYGFAIISVDEFDFDNWGITSILETQTTIECKSIINSENLFNGSIIAHITNDDLNKEYDLEICFNKNADTIGLYGYTPLTEIDLNNINENGPSIIDLGAFCSCKNLINIEIPTTIKKIWSYSFSFCINLTSVTIPDSVTSIGSYAFTNCESLTSVTIPNSVTEIYWETFFNCYNLKSVIIGKNVEYIYEGAFANCSSLTSVAIPDSVISIGSYAFEGCTSLTSVTIGSLVNSIGFDAFNACTSLTSITCNAVNAPTIFDVTFKYVATNGVLYYPKGSDYSSWMSTDSYYLGYYNWTSEEIESQTE